MYERYLGAFWEQEADLHQRALDRYNGLVADVARYDGYPPEEQAQMLQVPPSDSPSQRRCRHAPATLRASRRCRRMGTNPGCVHTEVGLGEG